jgi:hypothetical protein
MPETLNTKTKGLPGIPALLASSWAVYRGKIVLFVFVMLAFTLPLAIISVLGNGVLSQGSGTSPMAGGAVMAGFLIAFLLSILGQIAFVYAITAEGLSIGQVFGKSAERFFSFLWVYTLFGLITISGFIFIIPGIIFLTWFGFAPFILAKEDLRGVTALLKSKAYVKGRLVRVFGTMAPMWALSFGLSLIPFAGYILSLFFMPFTLIYQYLLYKDLKETVGPDFSFQPTRADKISWLTIALLGLLIIIALVALLSRPDSPQLKDIVITPTQQI